VSAAEIIPFELRGLTAEQVGELLGYTGRYVAEDLACKPDFPKATYAGDKPRWIAGEVLAYREATRASRRVRRRRTGRKSAAT
jgi:hypothetical protein